LSSKVSIVLEDSQVPLFGSVSFILTLSQSRVATIVSKEGKLLDPKKVEVIIKMPVP
jgi:hypothetical protein